MRTSTAYNRIGEIHCVIQSIYSGATTTQIHEQLSQRVWETSRYKTLPQWAQSKIHDIHHFIRSIWFYKKTTEKYIRLFYIGLDGRKIPTYKAWDLFTEEEKELCRATDGLKIHPFWMKETVVNHDDGSVTITLTPTDKVYWHSEMK